MYADQIQGDPREISEIFRLVGIDQADLYNREKFQQIQDIVRYFSGVPNKTYEIYKLMGDNVTDRISHVWRYIQVQEELVSKFHELSEMHETFTDEINEDLKGGYLTKEKRDLIRQQVQGLEDTERVERIEGILNDVDSLNSQYE